MKLGPNAPCPCGSGLKHKRCCLPILKGGAAASPEALMRSRYTAFALGRADHILGTTHPDSPHHQRDPAVWRAEVAEFSAATRFEGLKILAASAEGDTGHVTFRATLSQGARDTSFTERSMFHKVGGRWLYHSGEGG